MHNRISMKVFNELSKTILGNSILYFIIQNPITLLLPPSLSRVVLRHSKRIAFGIASKTEATKALNRFRLHANTELLND